MHARELLADPSGMAPDMFANSRPPTRIQSARPVVRPAWNNDTSPRYTANAELTGGMGLVAAGRPMSPRSPRNTRPMSAMMPPRPAGDAELGGEPQRPTTTQGTRGFSDGPTRGEGPRTRKLKESAL